MSELECAFTGIVGRVPELRTSKSGKPWATFPVCVGKDEDKQWLRVAIFGETAETLSRTLEKGNKVYAEGRLTASLWTPENGPPRINLDVAAFKCMRLNEIGRNKPQKPRETDNRIRSDTVSQRQHEPARDDEIPF